MAEILVIRDGDPRWWNSPDIWAVPGSDPYGPPGQPIAGEAAFVWARVFNRGDLDVSDARVNFYWSNPAAGVLRSNSTLIGSAFVDLVPGETKDVLCVIPWLPVIVNDGHECLVAELIHSIDPLPYPLPDEFNPPAYHQVAQRNLGVLSMKKRMLVMPIQISAPARKGKSLVITTETGGMLDKDSLRQLGLRGYRPAEEITVRTGLSLEGGCDNGRGERWKRTLEMSLKPGTAKAVYLTIQPQELAPRTYLLLHVISSEDKKAVGGITYALIRAEEE
ncbi:hypothetical protein JW905_18440 [bacterium]|nr:hypothetical protein [candidate division CSSED10-310 bacterium]